MCRKAELTWTEMSYERGSGVPLLSTIAACRLRFITVMFCTSASRLTQLAKPRTVDHDCAKPAAMMIYLVAPCNDIYSGCSTWICRMKSSRISKFVVHPAIIAICSYSSMRLSFLPPELHGILHREFHSRRTWQRTHSLGGYIIINTIN